MWLALALAPLSEALASEQDASEEIIVWGDRFARWERRWYVETEVQMPSNLRLFAWSDHQLDVGAYQLRAVLDCDKDIQLGRKSWEVSCEIQDLGLVVYPAREGPQDRVVAQQIDDTLTGARLQLQVSRAGGVPNVDLEDSGNALHRRHRQRQEQIRQLIGRAILPFHLELPEDLTNHSRWYEHNSQLMTLPTPLLSGTQLASMGSSTLVHYLDEHQGHYVVQTIGEGIVFPTGGSLELSSATDGSNMMDPISTPSSKYMLQMHGVALFDPESGIMRERVWAITSNAIASSTTALDPGLYRHSGRLALLNEADRPDVGDTWIADQPDAQGRVRPWVPLQATAPEDPATAPEDPAPSAEEPRPAGAPAAPGPATTPPGR